jgi:hypothetical protein
MCSTRVEERGSRIKSSRRMEGRTKELRGPSAIKSINPPRAYCITVDMLTRYSGMRNNSSSPIFKRTLEGFPGQPAILVNRPLEIIIL